MKKPFRIFLTLAFLLASCVNPATESTPIADFITFTAEQSNLQAGECTLLRWDVTDGFGVTLEAQPVDKVGQMEVCPAETRGYELAVDMGTHIERRQVEITVSGETSRPGGDQTQVTPGTPAYQAETWVFTGGPIGGLGYDIRMDPNNPDTLYVTDAYSGVSKSTDGGITWFASNNGITTRAGISGDALPVFSLSIDPNDSSILWAGTQIGSGVFHSTDGGETWQAMNTGNNGITEFSIAVRGFTVEPGNSNVVYFAGEVPSAEWKGEHFPGPEGLDSTKGVVYKTTDGGQTWTRLWYGDNLARYIWINPQDHNLIYVSTGIFDRNAANGDPATNTPGGVGILRSRNSGQTWEVLNEENGFAANELYFGSLFMHPTDPAILIAASGNNGYGTPGGVYLTEDGGDTWTKPLNAANMSAVEICIANPSVMYAGSRTGFFRSDDGGHTWQQLGQQNWGPLDAVAGFPIDMQCDPRNPMRIFVNNYGGGNFLSEDGGQTWVISSAGYTGALMDQIAVAQDNPALVYASARSGLFASQDGGQTWYGLAHGVARTVEGFAIAVDPLDSQHIIASLGDAGASPLVSYDGGQTWQQTGTELFTGENSISDGGGVQKAYFAPSVPDLVYATVSAAKCPDYCPPETGGGIILSRDGGQTWTSSGLVGENVSSLAIYPQDNSLLFAGTFNGNVYRSRDGGEAWELVAQNVGQGLILATLAVDPANPQKLYAGANGAVYISQDGGGTWQQSASGMSPEAMIVSFALDQNRPDIVYAASPNSGVFYSTDGGATWNILNDGLLTRAVVDLALSADGSVLYAVTYGAGVFRLGTPDQH